MNSILAIFKKFCLKVGFFNGVCHKYAQIARIHQIVNEDYGIVLKTYYKHSNYKNYPNKKAFRQLIPEIIELKKLISMFSINWKIFSFQYRQLKKLYRKKQYYQAGKLINKKSIDIQGNLFSLYQLAKHVEKDCKQLYYSKGNLELGYQNEDLQELYDSSQKFAFKFSQTKSAAINNLKPQIFAELSQHYKEKNFGQAARNFLDFISYTNFENGIYSARDYSKNDLQYIPYENYFVYCLEEQKELEKKWREQESSAITTFSPDSPYYFDYLKNKKWCDENNYSELFYQDSLWYAFPSNAVIPIVIPFKNRNTFEYQSTSAFLAGFSLGVMIFGMGCMVVLVKDETISLFSSCLGEAILLFCFLRVKKTCNNHVLKFNETNIFTKNMKQDYKILGFISVLCFGLMFLLIFSCS